MMNRFRHPAPVVLDTDIGTDIDDTWALAMLLRCPELDPRLVVTTSGDTAYRAHLAGAVLAAGGCADIPVAIGAPTALPRHLLGPIAGRPQGGLADSYDLNAHPGGVHGNGVEAMVECIMQSQETVTLIAIGPLTNVAAALELEPAIAQRARLVAMAGSIRRLMFDRPGCEPEYNVSVDVPACRAAFAAEWEVTITPLDSCGSIVLRDDRYQLVRRSCDPLIKTALQTYREWGEVVGDAFDSEFYAPGAWEHRSSVLFDTMAIYLAYSESLLEIEALPLTVEDDGTLLIADGAPTVRVALDCQRERFLDHLTQRLLGASPQH